jgi:hypothetical protein
MAKINSFNFGFIVIDGKQYASDVLILPDGTVKEREPGKGRFGSHLIKTSEIENMRKSQPDIILVGTGTSGLAILSGDAEVYITKANLNPVVLPSSEVVEKFNQLTDEGKRVAALIHITC